MAEIDIDHLEVYSNLKKLIKAQTGEKIPFSFRKNGDKHIFTVASHNMAKLNLSNNNIVSTNPWDIYVTIAQRLIPN